MRPLALASLWLALGCLDQEPMHPMPLADPAIVQAHSPAHLGVSPSVSLLSTPGYTQLDAATAAGTDGSLHLAVDAGAAIPRFPDSFLESVAVFGYAWVDGDTFRGIVAVIHPAIGRDSHQNPDAWHTHPVVLSTGTSLSTFCVAEIGTSQGGLTISDDILALHIAGRQAGIAASDLDVAASFVVVVDSGCPLLAPGVQLGVQVLSAQAL